MTQSFRVACAVMLLGGVLITAKAAAQIAASAADNDMDPSYAEDGWTVVAGAYQDVARPRPDAGVRGGYGMHDWLPPPDGNAYAGGAQYGGDPGTQSEIQKQITGLTVGREYAIEAFIMSDNIDGEDQTTDVYFDVALCGNSEESYHIPFLRKRTWIQQTFAFSADAESCMLGFRARGAAAAMDSAPSGWRPGTVGNGLNYIFVDSVQVSAASFSDFGLAVDGPASVPTAGGQARVHVSVTNAGPAEGSAPMVTYRLPRGVSAPASKDGSLAVFGADASRWTCTTVPVPGRSEPIAAREDRGRDNPSSTTITCTCTGPLAVGASSAFSLDVDFAAGDAGSEITSRLAVSPSMLSGNVDERADNDGAAFSTRASAETASDAGAPRADAGNPTCDVASDLSDSGACVPRAPTPVMSCNLAPGAPSKLAPSLTLGLMMLGFLLACRRRR